MTAKRTTKKTIYIHFGLPKTGSTFLRKIIFPRLKKVNYIDVTGPDILPTMFNIPYKHCTKKDMSFVKDYVDKRITSRSNLISYEILSGVAMYHGGKTQSQVMNDVKSMFSDYNIKILLVLRDQRDFIASLYAMYVHLGGSLPIEQFVFGKQTPFKRTNYQYHALIKSLHSTFGASNVHVQFYEDFSKKKPQFLKTMLNIMGESTVPAYKDKKVRKGYGVSTINAALFLNKFCSSLIEPGKLVPIIKLSEGNYFSPRLIVMNRLLSFLSYKKYTLPISLQKKLKPLYESDNKKLNKLLKLPKIYLSYPK